jgi:hypothetical protein
VSGLGRSLLQAGLVLALALPFLAIAGWRARAVRWSVVLLVGALAALDAFLVELPRVGLFRAHHWSWQESLLTLAWPFVLVAMIPESRSPRSA